MIDKFICNSDEPLSYVIHFSEHDNYDKLYEWLNKNRFRLAEDYFDFPRQYIRFTDIADDNEMRQLFKENIL